MLLPANISAFGIHFSAISCFIQYILQLQCYYLALFLNIASNSRLLSTRTQSKSKWVFHPHFFSCTNNVSLAALAHRSWKDCVTANGLAQGSSCLLLRCEPDWVVWQPDRNCSANSEQTKLINGLTALKNAAVMNHTLRWCKASVQICKNAVLSGPFTTMSSIKYMLILALCMKFAWFVLVEGRYFQPFAVLQAEHLLSDCTFRCISDSVL